MVLQRRIKIGSQGFQHTALAVGTEHIDVVLMGPQLLDRALPSTKRFGRVPLQGELPDQGWKMYAPSFRQNPPAPVPTIATESPQS